MRFVFGILLAAGAMNADANALSLQSWTTEVAVLAATIDEPNTPTPPTPVPNKVPRSQCKACNGTGRVKAGDGISWTTCENCTPDAKQGPGCRCGECRCEVCQCGLVREVALSDPCEGGTCEVGGHATAGACGAGGCATAHHSHGAGLRAGQPVRNVGRMGVGAARVVVRGAGAMARGAAAVVTVRFRARQNHGGPFPLMRAWRCRRGRCG